MTKQTKLLNKGLERISVKELIDRAATSPAFLVAYANKRNDCKVSYIHGITVNSCA